MQTLPAIVDQEMEIVPQQPEVVAGGIQFISLLEGLGIARSDMLLQDMLLMRVPEEDQADVMDAYNVEPIAFGEVVNQVLPVIGAAIFEHEGFVGKDHIYRERYFQVRLLVKLDGRIRLIKSSSAPLLRHVAYMCNKNGWFLFKEPIDYKFIWKGPGQPHYLDRVNKKLLERFA